MDKVRRNYQEDTKLVIEYFQGHPRRDYRDAVSDFQRDFGWTAEYTGSLISKLLRKGVLELNASIQPRELT